MDGRTGGSGLVAGPTARKNARGPAPTPYPNTEAKHAAVMRARLSHAQEASVSWTADGRTGACGLSVAPNARKLGQGHVPIQSLKMAARSVAGRTPKPRLAATGNVRLMVNGRTGECGPNAVLHARKRGCEHVPIPHRRMVVIHAREMPPKLCRVWVGSVQSMENGRTGECGLNAVPNAPKPAQDLAQTQPQRMAEKDAVAMSQNSYPVAMANASWMVSGRIGEYGQNVAPNARRQGQERAVIQHRRMAERYVAGTAKRVCHALAENAL